MAGIRAKTCTTKTPPARSWILDGKAAIFLCAGADIFSTFIDARADARCAPFFTTTIIPLPLASALYPPFAR